MSDLKGKGKAGKPKASRSSRACENCRKNKAKCVPNLNDLNGGCVACTMSSTVCKFAETKKRGPAKGYIDQLETRIKELEAELLRSGPSSSTFNINSSSNIYPSSASELQLDIPIPNFIPNEDWIDEQILSNETNEIENLPIMDQYTFLESPNTRQRRKLSTTVLSPLTSSTTLVDSPTRAFNFLNQNQSLRSDSIGHTAPGTSELEDVLGQLSLNENEEVRYQGRSSGLYLIKNSPRFNGYWNLNTREVEERRKVRKTEFDGLKILLPDYSIQQTLLNIYFTSVHPTIPILFESSLRKEILDGRVATVLLLSIFAIASKYAGNVSESCRYATAVEKSINHDYIISKRINVQALIILSYLEIGDGKTQSAWMHLGLAIRIAQDLGFFRDAVKTPMATTEQAKDDQVRKRVWYSLIVLDRWLSCFMGRPTMVNERDYVVTFPSEEEEVLDNSKNQIYLISTFNAFASLSVLIGRIINSIYSIGIRVSSQTDDILSILDQSLSSWYLSLPLHLQYTPGSGSHNILLPHVYSLHLAFYSALILLHRPFIPGSQTSDQRIGSCFPSHSICTAAATSATKIVLELRNHYSLASASPLIINSLFTAAIICVYNCQFDPSLLVSSKTNLSILMNALREMGTMWPGAQRQADLLEGLVDLEEEEELLPFEGKKRKEREESEDHYYFMNIPEPSEPYQNGFVSPSTMSGMNTPSVDYGNLLNSFLSPTEIAAAASLAVSNDYPVLVDDSQWTGPDQGYW